MGSAVGLDITEMKSKQGLEAHMWVGMARKNRTRPAKRLRYIYRQPKSIGIKLNRSTEKPARECLLPMPAFPAASSDKVCVLTLWVLMLQEAQKNRRSLREIMAGASAGRGQA